MEKSPFGNGFGPPPPGLNPMAAQFMALNHSAAAQAAQAAHAAQAAFLSQTGAIPNFPGLPSVTSSPNSISGRPDASAAAAAAAQLMKGPGLTSLEALQRYVFLTFNFVEVNEKALLMFAFQIRIVGCRILRTVSFFIDY